MISPQQGTEVVAKRPVITFRGDPAFVENGGVALLDGNDITPLLVKKDGVYSFTPVEPLSGGQHELYIIAFDGEGSKVEKNYSFASRQSETFEEVYSQNTISATQKTVMHRDVKDEGGFFTPAEEFPHASFDAYLSDESVLREGNFDSTARINLRYYDQNAALLEPEEKGLRVLDFLVAANYTAGNSISRLEFGDTTIDESRNTLEYLTRRGAKVSFSSGSLTVNGFSVIGEEAGYTIDRVGLGFNANDHIMGGSVQSHFMDDAVTLKGIYVRGGQEGEFIGTWSETGGRKGEVFGLVVTTDFFEQKFITEIEVDRSSFDGDTLDDLGEQEDDAYRIRARGQSGMYDYDFGYTYTGPDYEVVGNQSVVKDWAGFDFAGTMTATNHLVRFLANYSWDNVENESYFPRIYSLTSGMEYGYTGWQRFPASLMFEYNTQDSEDEPGGYSETSLATYQTTAKISYVDGPWAIDLRTIYSEQDDMSDFDADTELFTLEIVPAYSSGSFSILPSYAYNSSKDLLYDVTTDTHTITLDIYSSFFSDRVVCEAGGTYDWSESDDDTIDMSNADLYARLSYRFERLWRMEDSTIALEYHYKRQEDNVYDALYRENTVTLVLSTAFPYTF